MNIYGITLAKLQAYFEQQGENKSKATFTFQSLYKSRNESLDEIPHLKPQILEQMKKDFTSERLKIVEKCGDDSAGKILYELSDGNTVESVVMKHNYGNGLCVSSQIGCNMGCKFCESGRLKKVRDLTAAEMVLQLLQTEKELGIKISHVVVMGIGEPFDNYDNVMDFVEIITEPFGLELGPRHVTISTCGIVPRMEQYTARKIHNNLAVSLHAPSDEIRNEIMPINRRYQIKSVIEAAKRFAEASNQKVTFEYIMLRDVNDSDECAERLAALLSGIKCYVNLIPYNETTHIEYKKSDKARIDAFYELLKRRGVWVTIRREFGASVNAACGQLRASHAERQEK